MPGVIENGLFAKRTADIIIQATNSDILTLEKDT
jgi:ribose 5-phosphate isomerase